MGKASRRKRPKMIAGLPLARRCKLHLAEVLKSLEISGISWREYVADVRQNGDCINQAAVGAAMSWMESGSEVWIVRDEVQEVFLHAGLKGMDRAEVVMPVDCMFFALPDSKIMLNAPDGQIHRLAGFYLLQGQDDRQHDRLGLLMWGASNDPADPADDLLLYVSFRWGAGAKTDLEDVLAAELRSQEGFWTQGFREMLIEQTRTAGVACLRMAINSLLYLRHCVEDQGPPIEVDAFLDGKTDELSDSTTPARRARWDRQFADMWCARRFYEVAPDLTRQRLGTALRRRRSTSGRAGYTVGWHVRWTRYGRAKDDNGDYIPAHMRPARLTVIDSYEVKPSGESR